VAAHIDIPMAGVREFCGRWKIVELSLFGSVLRDDFRADSDIDVLVTFAPDETWSLLDLIAMRDELSELFGRQVDLAEENCLRNPFRRREILGTKERIYAA
jgi:predicted nucleotidyltransferase